MKNADAPAVKREAEEDGGVEARSALSVHPCWEHQPVARYSAGCDIAAESEPSTGTKLDIAATDQIRPIATTSSRPPTHSASLCPRRCSPRADEVIEYRSDCRGQLTQLAHDYDRMAEAAE
jgi:hypothetical protein